MPAKSKQQQKFMGMVHALNKGDIKPSDVSKSVKDVAKNIKKSDAEDFASTKHSGLPKKVKEQILNAFKEYANKMSGNKLGGGGSHDYAPQKGLRDDDGYEDEGPKDESINEKISRGQLMSFNKLVDKGENVVVHGKNGKRYIYQNSGDFKSVGVTDDTRSNPEKTYQVLPLNKIKKITIESVNEGMFSTLDQIRKDSKDVRDFVKNVFKDRDFVKMKNDKEFIKYLKSIYEGVDESKGVPQNYMQGRTSDYHTALRGKNRDYSGGTNFKKTNHGQPDIENAEEDEEVGLTNKQTKIDPPPPLKENYMMNRDVEDEMKRHRIKKIPIDSHGDKLLKGLKKEKFINKIDNKLKLTYFYASLPKGQRYAYASAKKPLSPLFDRFMNDLMGENIKLTSKMAAYRVTQTIVDMYNNNEEIDSPYYMLKNYFNSFGMDTNRSRTFNGAQFQLDQWLKRNKKYEKAMMKEAKLDHYRISGNSIELLVKHNREKLAIRFKDKRILDKMKFDWSKPKNIEKLLSLKKLPKGMSISRSFHESVNEASMDWEKNFKWANDKELKVISKFIFMNPKGIDGVIKMSKHKPSDFKKTIQKAAKAGLYKESINEAKYYNKADALTAYFKGKINAKELDSIARKQFKTGIATKKELSNFLSNGFTQDVMSDTYGIPKGTLVKRVRGLMKFTESINEKADPKKFRKGFVRGDVIVNDDNSRYVVVAQRGKQFIVGDNGERREFNKGKVGKKKLKGNLSLKDVLGESINEVKVETERYFGKKGIIIMIRDGNKLISAIFKDKKNADKFNRNKPADVKKLYQLAKKTKFPKTIDEYGQRLDLSFIDDEEARLDGTPKPKDAIDRDIDENVKVGQMIKYDDRFIGKGTAKVKHIIQAKPNKAGITHHYITNKGTFSNQSLIGSDDYKKRYNEYSGGSYEYTKGDQYGQNSVNEVGVFPIQNYLKGIIPSGRLDIKNDRDKEKVQSLLKDLIGTLNHFWKSHKIPFRVREPRKSDLNKFKQKSKRY